MSETAIKIEGLGKRYKIGTLKRHDTLRDQLVYLVSKRFSRNGNGNHSLSRDLLASQAMPDSASDTFWALKDVSFDVKRGEVVGIIGRNGAGKSTLLKILSRITEPTAGYADINGRVGSLLEVGTGFHPELTGRENIYLNGSILGMKRAEITSKFDEIVAFAEVEKFIDTPVKHYSSGMYVRLAFAVAAHMETEILLVDEVLAVGDAAFQKRCLGKMGDVARHGRTVLFVSHNMAAVENLCKRALLLDRGKVRYVGDAKHCVTSYLDFGSISSGGDVDLSSHSARSVGSRPLLKRVRLLDSNGNVRDRFVCGEPMKIEFTFDPVISLRTPQFGIGVNDWMGSRIFSITTYFSDSQLPSLNDLCKVTCQIDDVPLAPGRYSLSLSAGTLENTLIDNLENAVSFDVESADFYGNGRIPEANFGRVLVRSRWEKSG